MKPYQILCTLKLCLIYRNTKIYPLDYNLVAAVGGGSRGLYTQIDSLTQFDGSLWEGLNLTKRSFLTDRAIAIGH